MTPLSNLNLNQYLVIKAAGILLALITLLIAGIMILRVLAPVKFQTAGGATPQEKVLNDALELLTNQTSALTPLPGN